MSRWHQDSFEEAYPIAATTVPGILENIEFHYTEISAFGQHRWLLTDAISFGTGVRIGDNYSGSTDRDGGVANPGAIPVTHTRGHETLPATPRFDLSYQPNSRSFYYATIAKGFRSGGINGTVHVRCTGSADPPSFAPDDVWSFEVGAKNQLFDQRLQINTSIYEIHWNNIQENIDDACGNGYTTNSGAARSAGFDVDADAIVTDRLRVSLAVGLVNVRYTRTDVNADGQYLADRGTVVGGLPSVPAPWSGTVSARYEWPLGASTP